MNRTKFILSFCLTLMGSLAGRSFLPAGEWMTYRSTYTHDAFGQRVDQHTRPVEPLSPDQGNLVRSGYRHYRSTIQGSTTADNLHITHEWGRPVAPYEHWRFPYRPYGVPYDQWGPPVPNVLSNFNYQGNGFPGPVAPLVPGMHHGAVGNVPFGAGQGGSPNPAGNGFYPMLPPAPGGYPGGGYPGSGYPGGGYPGGGYPGGGYPGGGGYPNHSPSAPWFDGLYPSAPLR